MVRHSGPNYQCPLKVTMSDLHVSPCIYLRQLHQSPRNINREVKIINVTVSQVFITRAYLTKLGPRSLYFVLFNSLVSRKCM